jgi:sulfatase maturation enzyme AslB (radical SAM superfamily)
MPGTGTALLFITGNHRLFRVDEDLAARLRRSLVLLGNDEVREWCSLANLGLVSDVNRRVVSCNPRPEGSTLAINANLTTSCNMGCTYCFAGGGDYGGLSGSLQGATIDGLFRFIDSCRLCPGDDVRFEFFGGEPLLSVPAIENICRRAEMYRSARGVGFQCRISTNLTILPPAAVALIAEYGFTVSVSIDGDPSTHNRNRPTKVGADTYSTIIKNCSTLRQNIPGLTLVARMTAAAGTATVLENVK